MRECPEKLDRPIKTYLIIRLSKSSVNAKPQIGQSDMAKISIRRPHQLTHKQAVDVANRVAKDLAHEYGISAKWDGDIVHVKGTGLTGTLELAPKLMKLDVTLGFMLSVFQQKIQHGVEAKLDHLLDVKAKKPR